MSSRSRIALGALALPALVAGCGASSGAYGGGGGKAQAAAPAPSVTAAKAKAPALSLRSTSLGRVIVDAGGRTLYAFGHDLKNVSRCSGACATNWPPALVPSKKPKLGAGLSKSKLRVIHRSGKARQLSYAGHPLYRFAGDSQPGDVNGQGVNAFGGIWRVLAQNGRRLDSCGAGLLDPRCQ